MNQPVPGAPSAHASRPAGGANGSRTCTSGAVGQLRIFDIYGFVLAGLLLTMGAVGDRIGRRRLLVIGAVGFALSSLLAAFAPSATVLIIARNQPSRVLLPRHHCDSRRRRDLRTGHRRENSGRHRNACPAWTPVTPPARSEVCAIDAVTRG
ncbi:hypothetical protein CF165_48900 [Amycolatopsis vastitatis]|uniref:Major facilitator superfamily (MFS) profile domain-containing protein n=1 Tax=Amycolatopsis vastitatis TaxID=1905142 RepID=A0A229SK22_9PSEU|nr:hypothetical protein CF165_48900 [Amycolatopsis vastitatis]